jgi:hypothetical protein
MRAISVVPTMVEKIPKKARSLSAVRRHVPLLMFTHFVAFNWLMRPQPKAARALTGSAVASYEMEER